MKKLNWQSDSMEPAVDFGDTVRIISTGGKIESDGVYLFLLDREKIKNQNLKHLCAPIIKVMWRVTRLLDGRLMLVKDNAAYQESPELVDEGEFLGLWKVAGKVVVTKRNERGFRSMVGNGLNGLVMATPSPNISNEARV